MKTVKIYGKVYTVHPTCKKVPNLYWHDNTLTDVPLNYDPDGYIRMEDGNIVGVYGKKKLILPIIIGILVIAGGVIGYTLYTNSGRPKALEGTFVKVAQPGNNEINFNTFVQCNGELADIRFVNGASQVRISITGDGIESQPQILQPEESLATIPMHYNTDESVVEAQLTVEQDGSTYKYPIIIEIPNNMSTAGGAYSGTGHLISENNHPLAEEMFIQ